MWGDGVVPLTTVANRLHTKMATGRHRQAREERHAGMVGKVNTVEVHKWRSCLFTAISTSALVLYWLETAQLLIVWSCRPAQSDRRVLK